MVLDPYSTPCHLCLMVPPSMPHLHGTWNCWVRLSRDLEHSSFGMLMTCSSLSISSAKLEEWKCLISICDNGLNGSQYNEAQSRQDTCLVSGCLIFLDEPCSICSRKGRSNSSFRDDCRAMLVSRIPNVLHGNFLTSLDLHANTMLFREK